MAVIYKTGNGYEIIKSSREIYAINGKSVKYLGRVSESYRSTGKRIKGIPNEIKQIFFQIQNTNE